MPHLLPRFDLPQRSRLPLALTLSLLAHALALVAPGLLRPPAAPAKAPPLHAQLRPQVVATPSVPELELPPEPPPTPAPSPPPRKASPPAVKTWTQSVRDQLVQQQNSGLFYPAAAIAQGLEGEVLVYFIVDTQGNIAAARVEESSGQPLLDDAAVRAVRRLRSLPGDAPQEALLPVRFRLR